MNISDAVTTGYFLLHNIPDIVVSSPGAGETATVVIEVDDVTIYSEDLIADTDGNIVLTDLGNLLEPYVSSVSTVSINDNEFQVIYSRTPVRAIHKNDYDYISTWLRYNYLSSEDVKVVDDDDTIAVHLLTADETTMQIGITAAYLNNGVYTTASMTTSESVTITQGELTALTYTFTMAGVKTSLGLTQDIIGFSVSCNARTMRFLSMKGGHALRLKYKNNFGKEEYLTLQGVVVEKPDYQFTPAVISGVASNVEVKGDLIYSFESGPVTEATLAYIREMMTSDEVYMIEEGVDYRIVMTEADLPRSNDKSELQGVTFSFKRAVERGVLLDSVDGGTDIFDESFDWTFN